MLRLACQAALGMGLALQTFNRNVAVALHAYAVYSDVDAAQRRFDAADLGDLTVDARHA